MIGLAPFALAPILAHAQTDVCDPGEVQVRYSGGLYTSDVTVVLPDLPPHAVFEAARDFGHYREMNFPHLAANDLLDCPHPGQCYTWTHLSYPVKGIPYTFHSKHFFKIQISKNRIEWGLYHPNRKTDSWFTSAVAAKYADDPGFRALNGYFEIFASGTGTQIHYSLTEEWNPHKKPIFVPGSWAEAMIQDIANSKDKGRRDICAVVQRLARQASKLLEDQALE